MKQLLTALLLFFSICSLAQPASSKLMDSVVKELIKQQKEGIICSGFFGPIIQSPEKLLDTICTYDWVGRVVERYTDTVYHGKDPVKLKNWWGEMSEAAKPLNFSTSQPLWQVWSINDTLKIDPGTMKFIRIRDKLYKVDVSLILEDNEPRKFFWPSYNIQPTDEKVIHSYPINLFK
jgi:hypothetical protein